MINIKNSEFDAIVIGSGITGGWAAKELCEKGLKVLMIERGRDFVHGLDHLGEHAPSWKFPFQGKPDREQNLAEYPIQSKSYAFSEANKHIFNNDALNPYVHDERKPFDWIRADVVGGKSLLWGRQAYRFSDHDLKANRVDGHGVPWPIDYAELAPWYSYVEDHIGISGEALGLDVLPDSNFLPPMEMYSIEKTIKKRLSEKSPNTKLTIGRAAVLTKDHKGRSACHYCGPCHRGCSTGSYFSSHSSTLPAARATNNLTLISDSVVESLIHDPVTGKIKSVRVIDANTLSRSEYTAKLVFLCASTIASTQILLNSVSERYPNGLGNDSGVLGRYLMDHVHGIAGVGVFLDDMESYYHGNRPNGTYIPRFRNNPGEAKTDFLRGYGYQGKILRTDWSMNFNQPGFGDDFKETLRKPGAWLWALVAFGECLPQYNNRMYLDSSKKDRFGIPLVRFDCTYGDNENGLWKDAVKSADSILKAAGAALTLGGSSDFDAPGSTIHEMGTARMGDDPAISVLNKHNQFHGIPNLFLTDGACMPSSSCVNPSLTYMALTVRACDYAVQQLRTGLI